MKRRILILSAITLIAFAGSAMADLPTLLDNGTPMEGESWLQRFVLTDLGDDGNTFDLMTIEVQGGSSTFEPPYIDNFAPGPASPFTTFFSASPVLIQGEGVNIGTLAFDLHFTGDFDTSTVLLHFVLEDNVDLNGLPVTPVGFELWALYDYVADPVNPWVLGLADSGEFEPLGAPVPVPAAALLGLLGMAGAGWGLRKTC